MQFSCCPPLLLDCVVSPACGCDPSGITNDGDCNASGACSCKMNVGGAKCSECLEGFFNFSAANPDGCQGEWRGTAPVPSNQNERNPQTFL